VGGGVAPDFVEYSMSEIPVPAGGESTLSYDDALRFAMQLHRRGRVEGAERIYRTLCAAKPEDPNPVHFLGVLHQRCRDEGLELIRRSIAMDATVASWHNNLGNVLLDRGERDEAFTAYSRCVELDPDNLEVLNNLAVLLRSLKRYAEAEATLKRAVAKDAKFADAHSNLAALYYEQRRILEGHEHIAAVLALQPANPTARKMLGLLYASLGRLEEAAAIFREWLEHDPKSEQARHHLAACTPGATPERATEGYVEHVFDAFAESFDAKLATLEYRAPQLVGATVARLFGEPEGRHRILDAGCGTGLCARYLKDYARVLVGVDLSGHMLERARAGGQYTELAKSDLVIYLEQSPPDFDLIVSADTLCYFGKLDRVTKAARRALRDGGVFVFTVEAHLDAADYRLNPNGRYSHAADYVRRSLQDAKFDVLCLQADQLRKESDRPVDGWLVAAKAA
jgi:predicted TPR repeat methyltransferase